MNGADEDDSKNATGSVWSPKRMHVRNRTDLRGCDTLVGLTVVDSCGQDGVCCDDHDACYRKNKCVASSWDTSSNFHVHDEHDTMYVSGGSCATCNDVFLLCVTTSDRGKSSCCARNDCGQTWDYTTDIVDEHSNVCSGFVEKLGLDLSGNDIGDSQNPPVVPSKEDCCLKCFKDTQCQSYTWNSANKKCYLKTSSSGSGMTYAGAQSGVRQGK